MFLLLGIIAPVALISDARQICSIIGIFYRRRMVVSVVSRMATAQYGTGKELMHARGSHACRPTGVTLLDVVSNKHRPKNNRYSYGCYHTDRPSTS